jgi:hypothetical protein
MTEKARCNIAERIAAKSNAAAAARDARLAHSKDHVELTQSSHAQRTQRPEFA